MKFQQTAKILVSILILIFSYDSVFPHSCATFKNLSDKEHAQKLDQVSAIFLGEVTSSKDENEYVQIVEMRVLRVWKGVEKDKITIKHSNPCSMDSKSVFLSGSKIMVYGYTIQDSEMISVDCCNFSLFDDEKMKKIYGEGKVIEQFQPSPTKSTEGFCSSLWKKITSFFS